MMFSQTSNGLTLKSFNLKGKSRENKILRMAEVGQNIPVLAKKLTKLLINGVHVTNYDFSVVLRACILLFHLIGHHKLSKSYNFSLFHFSGY